MLLMEAVVDRENMTAAYKRVMANKGAPGVDGMPVEELLPFLNREWAGIKEDLLADWFAPSPVRLVEMPKPGGGVRTLGIPTVLDRLVQQALLQVLTPVFDPTFSESSFGFRPGRGAHDAVLQARSHVASGKRWVVDLDLEKFFDRVNHDVLMSRVARRVGDKRVLRLIRRFLQAGVMMNGLVAVRSEWPCPVPVDHSLAPAVGGREGWVHGSEVFGGVQAGRGQVVPRVGVGVPADRCGLRDQRLRLEAVGAARG